ncbi:MAG: hypothetical protein ACSLE0_06665 [Chitinophagaceae bacterium]
MPHIKYAVKGIIESALCFIKLKASGALIIKVRWNAAIASGTTLDI